MAPRESIEWSVVGHDIARLDGPEKVRGELAYIGDMEFPGALHLVLARSDRPHAKILHIDTEAAAAAPGVIRVVVGEDIRRMKDVDPCFGPAFKDQPMLAIGKVRYAGEPIAAVAAESKEAAEAAAALIDAGYEDLPAVFGPLEAAREGAPLLHDALEPAGAFADLMSLQGKENSNICTHYKLRHGDARRALEEADQVFEDTFYCPPVSHAHLEPHGSVATWGPGKRLTVYSASQSPFFARADLARIFGLPLGSVRVIVPPVGGSYGGKIYVKLEPITCLMAKLTGRTVRCHLSREEVFFTSSRHAAVTKIWTGIRAGKITARKMEIYYDAGAYAEIGPRITQKTGSTAPGPYKIPHVQVDAYCVYTNKTPAGPLRGFGVPQLSIAYETHMEKAAAYLGRDPVELRRAYVLEEGDLYPTGSRMTSIGLKACLEEAARQMDWAGGGAPKAEGPILRGRSVTLGIKSVLAPSVSNAIVELNSDGSALVRCATVEMGQGATTAYAMMAAEELGLSPQKVRVTIPDTDQSPFDTITAGARSIYHMGNAVQGAARSVRKMLLETAAEALEADAEELDLKAERAFVRSTPERSITIPQLFIRRFGAPGTTLTGVGTFQSQIDKSDPETGQTEKMTEHWFAGAVGAEVEVDTETGFVKITKLAIVGDAGRAINPRHCVEQLEGAAIMTLGFTLFEEMRLEDGRLVNGSFLEYPLPAFRDVPADLRAVPVEYPVETGPYGARGIGESGTLSFIPAVLNAIHDAAGIWLGEVPVTPEKVLRALRKKEGKEIPA